jgi:hypothetical protein
MWEMAFRGDLENSIRIGFLAQRGNVLWCYPTHGAIKLRHEWGTRLLATGTHVDGA